MASNYYGGKTHLECYINILLDLFIKKKLSISALQVWYSPRFYYYLLNKQKQNVIKSVMATAPPIKTTGMMYIFAAAARS